MTREYIIKVDDTKTDIMGGTPLEEQPKELIRCKDCKKYEADKYNPGFGDCFGSCDSLPGVEENFFCADGERKDGDGEKSVEEIEAFLRKEEPFMFEWHDGGDDIY